MSSTMESSNPVGITPADAPMLTLTDKAVEKVKYFAGSMPDSEGKPLRIFVQGGANQPNAAQISSLSTPMRQIQFALKVLF